MLFFLQTDCFNERKKFWMFQKNMKGIFNILKNTQNHPKNGHDGKVRIQRFCQKLKFPKTCFFFFKPIVSMKEKNFQCFRRIGMVFSTFQKILKVNQKMATPVRSGYSDFAKNWKVPKTCFSFFKPIVFTKEQNLECFGRIGRVFSLFQKMLKIKKKNGHAGKVRIHRFSSKWKSTQNIPFFSSNWLFSWENIILNVSRRIGRVFSLFQKILKINQKMVTPAWSGYSDFAKYWKVPKTCFFFFKPIVFMIEQNFECFRRIGRVFSTFQKIFKINQKMATPVRSGYSDFAKNWKVPKTCFSFFKPIVFTKEQNLECFGRIGRVFSLFQKMLKINKKMAMPVRSGYIDFRPNWKVPKTFLFFLQRNYFHERTKFWIFLKNWKGIFNISKNTQNQQKNGHAGKVRIQRFCQKLKSPQNILFFLQSDSFHERTKCWMFPKNWNSIFIISKDTQNQPKNGTPVRSGYSDFAKNWEVPKTRFFFFKPIVFMKEQNFECFRRIGSVFSAFEKILKINQKMAIPVKSGYSDFPENWKVPKTCFFFFKVIVFMKEQNFECFRRIGRVFSLFQKILKINKKMGMPVSSGYSNFAENWEVPKKCFSLFKPIVFIKEQNFECFRRIGRVFSTFQKILKINQKMPRR